MRNFFSLLILLYSGLTPALPRVHWSTLVEVVERHEFYLNNQVILKPAEVWQTLFGIVYPDRNLNMHKDCVYYFVPGPGGGILKIKTIGPSEKCESFLEAKGDQEITDLKALQFSLSEKEISLHFTHSDFKLTSWKIPVANKYERVRPELAVSSAEYRAPKMILLAPVRLASGSATKSIASGSLCHSIDDNCNELSPSTCQQCPEGWYEIPNGCQEGPKYCGRIDCGRKNQPACRRGMIWQRQQKKYECRTDSSFAFCSEGLAIQCEGNLPWCR